MIEEQIKMIKKLKQSNIITNEEILNIMDAFQIASAQGYAIGKTKGILDYMKNYGEIIIKNDSDNQNFIIMNKYDLSKFYKNIEKNINIEIDVNFASYF